MKKLTIADLTPAMMEAISKMKTPDEIIAFCESKGFEIAEDGAKRILEQIDKVNGLTASDLEAVAGGFMKKGKSTGVYGT